MNRQNTVLNIVRKFISHTIHSIPLSDKSNWMVSATAPHLDVVAQSTGENHEN